MSDIVPPPPGPASNEERPTGGTLLASAWAALRHDRELIGLPVIGALVGVLAILPLLVVAFVPDDSGAVVAIVGVLMVLVFAIVTTFFAVALAAGAHERMNGGDPTISSSLRVAWTRKWSVVGWALLSTTVGLVLRVIEERLGFIGAIIRFLGGVAWALASYFVLPIIATNDINPIEALKLSGTTFKNRWSSAVRVELRMTLYVIGLFVLGAVGVFAVVVAANSSLALAVLLGILIGVPFVGAVLVLNALSSYVRVVLYRYAVGMPTPGFAPAMLQAAVKVKG
jgi:hypothetical protein